MRLILLILAFLSGAEAKIEDHYKKLESKRIVSQGDCKKNLLTTNSL